ncbi:universal stress protein [Verrucomicrobiaceae bacterium N1E253]|uniref:Universal stress protein n=1 Tax=Oceaniferula marina TaxID=2748318 RepID=A0A851GSR8_9BACT|nr:universal stress protein [Oceaniferula marina]NWK57294.1 universal stress protein [Oceaniferula marina]
MNPSPSIVVGIDYSASSAKALRKAVHAGTLRGGSVVAVHVLSSSHLQHWAGHKDESFSQDDLIEQSREQLSAFIAKEAPDAEVEQIVCVGRPADQLARVVSDRGASVLVVAANDMSKGHLGTTASSCLRFVPSDVLVVRNWQSGNFKKIVVCTDCSPTSERVVEKAIEIAVLHGATLEILHVIYPPKQDLWGEVLEDAADDDMSYPERMRHRSQETLNRTLIPLSSQLEAVKYSTVILESTVPSVEMTCHLEDVGADLAVLGTRQHSKLTSLFLGTNAERMMHDAKVSVLAVRY